MIRARRRLSSARSWNFWPGFVDALAALLIVILFVLTVFIVGHVYLNRALYTRDASLLSLKSEVSGMQIDMDEKDHSMAALQTNLDVLTAQHAVLSTELAQKSQAYEEAKEALHLANLKAVDAEDMYKALQAQVDATQETKQQLEEEAGGLRQELLHLKKEFQRIARALELSTTESGKKDEEIKELGERLNTALSRKIEELAKYRSEFFGKLREVLGDRQDVDVVGDRFVFQSEVLFPSASTQLSAEGKSQLAAFAKALLDVQKNFPPELHWILRVDGHTDIRPIQTAAFPSNWHLSAARALEVVQFLITQGVDPKNLGAAGFGAYHPLNSANTAEAHKQNRRIELKLDQQ